MRISLWLVVLEMSSTFSMIARLTLVSWAFKDWRTSSSFFDDFNKTNKCRIVLEYDVTDDDVDDEGDGGDMFTDDDDR